MAEAHVQREKEELRSLHGIFERTKADCDRRVAAMEEKLARGDMERREADSRAWSADEGKRASDLKLAEAARREQVEMKLKTPPCTADDASMHLVCRSR